MKALILIILTVSILGGYHEINNFTPHEGHHEIKEKQITVHLVPHTHNDVGFRKTVDQYYSGSKDMIRRAGVNYILDTVFDMLKEDKS